MWSGAPGNSTTSQRMSAINTEEMTQLPTTAANIIDAAKFFATSIIAASTLSGAIVLAMYSGRQRRSAHPQNLARCCGQEATNVGTNPSLWPTGAQERAKSHQWTARRDPTSGCTVGSAWSSRAASLGSPLDTVNTIDHRCDVDAQNGRSPC